MLKDVTLGLVDTFQKGVSQISKFVDAASPAVMQHFGQVMQDNMATLGEAFMPLAEAAIQIARDFGGMLQPIMRELKPAMEELAGIAVSLGKAYADELSVTLPALLKLGKLLIPLVDSTLPLLEGFFVLMAATISAIVSAITGDLGDVKGSMQTFKSAMQDMASAVVKTTAYLVSLYSAKAGKAFLEGAIGALTTKREDNTGAAAAQNAQIGSMQSLSQSVTKAALLAGPEGQFKDKDEAFRVALLADLQALQKGLADNKGAVESVNEAVVAFFKFVNASPIDKAKMLKDRAIEGGRNLFGSTPLGNVILNR